mgnify:CR=1 FL=1
MSGETQQSLPPDDLHTQAGEYVLGTLNANQRRSIESRLTYEPALRAAVDEWEQRLLPLTTRDPRPLLDDGEADMAVGYFPAVLADLTARAQAGGLVAFDSRRLYEGEYLCVMRKDHPLAHVPLTLEAPLPRELQSFLDTLSA